MMYTCILYLGRNVVSLATMAATHLGEGKLWIKTGELGGDWLSHFSAFGDSAPYLKSGLCAVQAQLTMNKIMHRYFLRVCVFCLDAIYNPMHPPGANVSPFQVYWQHMQVWQTGSVWPKMCMTVTLVLTSFWMSDWCEGHDWVELRVSKQPFLGEHYLFCMGIEEGVPEKCIVSGSGQRLLLVDVCLVTTGWSVGWQQQLRSANTQISFQPPLVWRLCAGMRGLCLAIGWLGYYIAGLHCWPRAFPVWHWHCWSS